MSKCVLHSLHCTLYTPHSTIYTLHSTLYTPHSTLYTLHSTLHTLHFTLHTLHSPLYTFHSTLHTPLLLGPKKLQNQQFYIIDWIRKKLLVDVANLATCCHDDYDVLLEVLGTLGKCYVSNPVAKTLVWIENHDWHNCFCMSSWGSPLLDPKKPQNEQFYIIDWIRKKTPGRCCQSGSLLPWWLWCTIGGFGNPGQMLC